MGKKKKKSKNPCKNYMTRHSPPMGMHCTRNLPEQVQSVDQDSSSVVGSDCGQSVHSVKKKLVMDKTVKLPSKKMSTKSVHSTHGEYGLLKDNLSPSKKKHAPKPLSTVEKFISVADESTDESDGIESQGASQNMQQMILAQLLKVNKRLDHMEQKMEDST